MEPTVTLIKETLYSPMTDPLVPQKGIKLLSFLYMFLKSLLDLT